VKRNPEPTHHRWDYRLRRRTHRYFRYLVRPEVSTYTHIIQFTFPQKHSSNDRGKDQKQKDLRSRAFRLQLAINPRQPFPLDVTRFFFLVELRILEISDLCCRAIVSSVMTAAAATKVPDLRSHIPDQRSQIQTDPIPCPINNSDQIR